MIDNGPRWWLVELADEAAVRAMQPALAAIARLTQATDAVGLAVFARCPQAEHDLVVRAFCPADGIDEDPVTGSANAAIAAWLHLNQSLPAANYRASQGREIGQYGFDEFLEVKSLVMRIGRTRAPWVKTAEAATSSD